MITTAPTAGNSRLIV